MAVDADGKKMKEERNIRDKKSDLALSRFSELMMDDRMKMVRMIIPTTMGTIV